MSHMTLRSVLFALAITIGLTWLAGAEKLTTVGDAFSIHVTDYGEGILRFTIRPNVEWVYEVEHVVTAHPLPPERAQWSFSCADANCDLSTPFSRLTTQVEGDGVYVEYSSRTALLARIAVNVSAVEKPHVHFEFPSANVMYGLAEHAADLPLRPNYTYDLYNTDAFRYPLNSSAALYGAIPFIMAHSAKATTGVLFLNSAEMNVHIEEAEHPSCQWNAEVGLTDIFFLPGPTPAKVQQQHATLTGGSVLPPYFSLGYHQCRWNYLNTKDCLAVDEGFDRHGIPYDVLWLDVEHTVKKKYFTWDKYTFPDPKALTDALASKGRKLVTVKDPHVKRESGYFVHDEAQKGNYYVKTAAGTEYEGDCWPGRSSWPDFYNTRTREWYSTFFHDDRYPGGSRDIHTWVDMNEPSVFKGPKGTMDKTAVHVSDDGRQVEHRFIHNMYGLLTLLSVYKGSVEAGGKDAKPLRPFILTRSFFPGSHRYAAMWNGDNMAQWDHLASTFPELLSLSLCNYAFTGADVGGFFFDTEEELFVRWIQSGVFYPFFRAHAHLDTHRREPWTFSEEAIDHVRNAIVLRYALIPYLYTTFYHAHRYGSTVLRPLVFEFPTEEDLFEEQDSFLFGPALLVRPVVQKGTQQVTVRLPSDSLWYSYATGELTPSGQQPVQVTLGSIPMYVRGGYTVPMKLRVRRSTKATRLDPFTLYVALNRQGNSYGDLYLDDGESFDYERGAFIHRQFSYSSGTLRCMAHPDSSTNSTFTAPNEVERVVIFGYQGRLDSVVLQNSGAGADAPSPPVATALEFERVGSSIVVRKPDVKITDDWAIVFVGA